MLKRSLFVLVLFVLLILGFYLFINKEKKVELADFTTFQKVRPTPFLFQELTIPYLRSREYKSQLNEQNLYQDNGGFNTYLTSYDSDGVNINALLTVPKGERPAGGFPAIVFVHGYIAPSIYRTTEKYTDYVNYLTRNGFVVLKIDLRGHGNSEGTPSGSYYSNGYVVDTLNAYSALQNSEIVNKEKIYLWGHSMAGNITFRSFVVNKNIPKVVVWAGAGYTYEDLLTYRINDTSYRPPTQNNQQTSERQKLMDAYGSFNSDSEFWKQVPGTNYLEGVNGAIQIHHAIDDSVVSIEYTRNLMKILDNTDIPHNFYEYATGGHNIEGSSFVTAMQRTVEFLKK